ncbi:MAG: Hsp20/alpha crystallin family protein [Haliscomenobacter sp.]
MKPINSAFAASNLDQFVENFFNRSLNGFVGNDQFAAQPMVNIYESEAAFTLEIAAPGLDRSDFDVRVEGEQLIVSSTKAQPSAEEEKNKCLRKEYSYSTFSKSFRLPKHTESERIEASYAQGVLKLQIPKSESVIQRYRTIEIQ